MPHHFGTVSGMEDVRVDADGEFRCWKCDGKNFREKRTFRAKAIGVSAGLLATPVAAAGILATKKKLYCLSCGEYNQVGNAQPISVHQDSSTSPPPVSYGVAKTRFEVAMMDADQRTFRGINATVTVSAAAKLVAIERPDTKEVKRSGQIPGIERIPFSYVLGVVGKNPLWERGYLQILVHGKSVAPHCNGSEVKDPNTIQFDSSQIDEYSALLNVVEPIGHMNATKNTEEDISETKIQSVVSEAPTTSLASEIQRLAELRKIGLLTDEEFSRAKLRLLGQ